MRVKQIGRVIKLNPEMEDEYRALHSKSNPGVRDLLQKYNIHNFSIFVRELDDGNKYLFSYCEYTGDDYASDRAALGAEPRNKEWQKLCLPCQEPLEGEQAWSSMEQIYYNE